jgi:lysophospholipase L1-like esterase
VTTCILLTLLTTAARAAAPTTKPHDFAKWEKAIAAFEEHDKTSPPPKGALLFTGASTITKWKTLEQDLADQKVLNRAFGGSEIADVTHFADRMIFPYEPKAIYIRSGGNDIHNGKTVEQVFQDYKDFVAKVREKMPTVPIIFISLSPSISRWSEADANKQLNALIEQYSKQSPNLAYIDTWNVVLGPDGKPRPELFVEDKLHFSPEGYKLFAERVKSQMPKM